MGIYFSTFRILQGVTENDSSFKRVINLVNFPLLTQTTVRFYGVFGSFGVGL